jgi:hypothetical protein
LIFRVDNHKYRYVICNVQVTAFEPSAFVLHLAMIRLIALAAKLCDALQSSKHLVYMSNLNMLGVDIGI